MREMGLTPADATATLDGYVQGGATERPRGFGRPQPCKAPVSQPRPHDHRTEPWSGHHSPGLLFGSFLQSKETGRRREMSGFPVAPATGDHKLSGQCRHERAPSIWRAAGLAELKARWGQAGSRWRLQGGAVLVPPPASRARGSRTPPSASQPAAWLHRLSGEDTGPTGIIPDHLPDSGSLTTQPWSLGPTM